MNYSTKKAFTLIELVISIVIIALASATLPIMLGSANKLQEQTVNQDIFFKSITVMTDIISKSWDKVPENDINTTNNWDLNTSDANNTMIWYLPHSNGDMNLSATVGAPQLYRYGSLQNFNYRKFYSTTDIADVHASNIPSGVAQLDSNAKYENINEYNDKYISESSADGANVDYNISVRYVEDNVTTDATGKRQSAVWSLGGTANTWTAAANSTHLKRVAISATRNMGGEEMKVGFAYFSSNIGVSGLKTDPQ